MAILRYIFTIMYTALWEFIFTYLSLSLFISRDQRRSAKADRDPQNINKANISMSII